jgi:hypothetical protein
MFDFVTSIWPGAFRRPIIAAHARWSECLSDILPESLACRFYA